MATRISAISSMATRELLAELFDTYRHRSGVEVTLESVGGVDAAKRVHAGEPFDVVVLAADAIDKLAAGGHVAAETKTDLARSPVAIAVRSGSPRPDIGSEEALRRAVLAARSVGYSTGPSGTALIKLFELAGIAETIRERLVQAPAGVPVGKLLVDGQVELGFQQLSELMHLSGIEVIGPMPPGLEIVTTFAAARCAASAQADAVAALLGFMRSPAAADAKRRNGMEPA